MVNKEIFNLAQIQSEQLAKIALATIPKTWGGEVKKFGDLVGVIKDGIFYTGTIDGVGAKLEIAAKLNSFYELGIDVVNSQINDLIRFGVEPKFFLSIISCASQNEKAMKELIRGQVEAATQANVPIIGGETEVLKDILFKSENKFNLAVVAVGWEEFDKLITREGIEVGDGLFVLPSSGLHTNGFSEIVKRFDEIDLEEILFDLSNDSDQKVQDWLIKPTVSYLKDIRLLCETGIKIKAAEHVTGGGFTGRLGKVLPDTGFLRANIKSGSWSIPPIFDYLQQKFDWSREQMGCTFNMGVGMFLVIDKADCKRSVNILLQHGIPIYEIGRFE